MAANRVLIVDDESNVLEGWARALRLAGYHVRTALSSVTALKECDEHAFDVVILDFLMPTMTGVVLLSRIRKKLSLVRSIIVSGKLDEGQKDVEIAQQLREGVEADLYLHKPVSNERLVESIRTLCGSGDEARDWAAIAGRAVQARRSAIGKAKRVSVELKRQVRKKRKN